jgi:hypothetical protein
MKLSTSAIRNSLFILAVIFALAEIPSAANAQDNPEADKQATTRSKFPAAKAQSAAASEDADADAPKQKAVEKDKDGQDELRKRDEWFYKQRSSANGHIPAGARAKSLAHMQRMMEAEGKLVHRPDGSVAEVTPFAGSVTNTWTSIGPTPTVGGEFSPVTGRITTIAIDPTDATGSTVLIGGAQGGIWRTTNAGATWAAVGDQNASLAMGSIAFAPSAPATVYAGTGEQASIGFDVYYGAGVLKSTNGGLTWTQTCTTAGPTCPFIGPFDPGLEPGFGFFSDGGARISYIAVNPTNPNLVLAAAQVTNLQTGNFTAGGIYCSTDAGATWTNLITNLGAGSFVGFASSTVAYAAIGDPFGGTANGIYKSTNANGGATPSCSAITFTQQTAAALPPQPSMGRIDLGIAPSDTTGNTVYASIADGTNGSNDNLGVWVTTNGGTSWTQQVAAPDVCNAQCWYDNVIKVDPNNAAIAFLGGAALGNLNTAGWVQRTTNTGGAWTSVIPTVQEAGLPHVDVHAMAFIKLTTGKVRMYMGNDGGIWRTDDAENATVTWTNLNDSTLTLTQFYPAISIHPSSQAFAFAGAQDNGSQIYSQPTTGTSWTDNQICGDGTGTAIDNVVPSTVYVDCNGIGGLAVSTINGQINTFFTATNGINPADNASFVPPLVTDPSTANTAYVGTTKVYQSVNTGSSWTALTSDLVNGANGEDLTALVVAPGNPKVVYAGANTGQIFVATNVAAGAGTFAPVAGQSSLPPRQVGAITVDPADATGNTAYAAFSGFSFVAHGISDPIGHLFKTTNGGTTWTDVSCTVDTTPAGCSTPAATDLPNSPVNDVVVDPDVPGTLYAATDIGVFQGTCTTSGTTTCTWTTLSTGLPRVAVLSLKLHRASRTLRAATHGRGVWDIVLNNFTFTTPHISSISPVSANAGATAFTLTLNGVGLTSGTVQWNGSATNVTTQQVSDTQLTATIAAALVGGAGTPQVTVNTTAGPSNALTFTVLGGAPTITSVSPTSAQVNAAATPITVTGTGFASNAVVIMNPDVGGTLTITPSSVTATQIKATVPATFLANFGSTNSVGVQNPPPGGGTTVTTQTVTLPTFTVIAPAPINDNFANAINITTNSFTDTKDSSGATTQTTDPAPPCSQDPTQIPFTTGISNTIWYKFTPASSGTITDVDTIGSSYDSVLSIWTGSGTTETSLTATLVACNDDIVPGIITQSQIQGTSLSAGTTYYIMVSSFGAADPNPIAFGGKSVLNFTFAGSTSGNFSISATAASVTTTPAPGGTMASGTSTITMTPNNGFAGVVAITCGAFPGVTCTPLSLPSGTTTGTLTINVLDPSSSMTAMVTPSTQDLWAANKPANGKAKGWLTLSGGTGLAAIILLLLPGRKRFRAALGLGLVCILSLILGCGGGSGGGGGGGGGGLMATTTQLTLSTTKLAATGTLTVSATVAGGTPTGSVQFIVDGAAVGNGFPVTNGTTGSIMLTAANAPPLFALIGTHTVSAHYLGDAKTAASSSGMLNVNVTGTANLAITGTSGGSTATANMSLTIQ